MQDFFTHIFYGFATIALLHETVFLANPKKQFAKLRIANEALDGEKETKEKWLKDNCAFALFMMLYYMWVVIGFFSSQWVLFMVLFTLSLFWSVTKLRKAHWFFLFFDALISMVIILSIIYFKYHS